MINRLPTWINEGREGKSREMRHLLRDYVLVLANTGIRHGTEAENLRWKHLHIFEEKGKTYLEMSVSGKTGQRDLICRANTITFLKRIQSRCSEISQMKIEELIGNKLDLPVFRLPNGDTTKNLRQPFKLLMEDTKLLKCPRTGRNRTLYSLRHTYATFALLKDQMNVHTLAIQMGTSIGMIERHYSHLTPRLRKEALTGKRYNLTEAEYRRIPTITGQALERSQIDAVIGLDNDIDEFLPENLLEDISEIELKADETQQNNTKVANTTLTNTSPTSTIAEYAFDLFDAGHITESGLLSTIEAVPISQEIRLKIIERSLSAISEGRLTEASLIQLLPDQLSHKITETKI
jgi:hypothetical protein